MLVAPSPILTALFFLRALPIDGSPVLLLPIPMPSPLLTLVPLVIILPVVVIVAVAAVVMIVTIPVLCDQGQHKAGTQQD